MPEFKKPPFSWRCPFCDQNATITDVDYSLTEEALRIGNSDGDIGAAFEFIVCPNPTCKKPALSVGLFNAPNVQNWGRKFQHPAKQLWTLIPVSGAKVFPDYVPAPIRTDYEEACLIRELSPKAAATLARRCLQG